MASFLSQSSTSQNWFQKLFIQSSLKLKKKKHFNLEPKKKRKEKKMNGEFHIRETATQNTAAPNVSNGIFMLQSFS